MHEHDESLDTSLRDLLATSHRVAVVGASGRRDRPSYQVPAYLARHGYEIVAVNPRYVGEELHGHPVVASLGQLETPIDIVDLFRRSDDVTSHVDEILALEPLPRAVWLQLGIRNDVAADRLRSRGIEVVQDRCIEIEHRRLLGAPLAESRA
ncbi:MAG: CoA-binding protein [Deinococcales bacterium]|jgi:predicted CoA-binding protein